MRVLSLFDGMACGYEALQRAGIPIDVYYASEIDKYAIQIAKKNHPDIIEIGDITQIKGEDYKDIDIIIGGSPCFVKGTKVWTTDGYKDISEIVVGDNVLGLGGEYNEVVKTGGQKKQIWSIKGQGFLETLTTENHPYYVAKCKRVGHDSHRELQEPEWKQVKDIEVGDYVGLPIIHQENNIKGITKQEAWLLGRYMADGHTRKDYRKGTNRRYYQVIYSIGDSKLGDFDHIYDYHISKYKHTQSTHRFVISSKRLVELCEDIGCGAINKSIPMWVLHLPSDILIEFFKGYVSGDGFYKGNGVWRCSTISRNMAMALCLLSAKLFNTGTQIHYCKREKTHIIQGRVANQNDYYEVEIREYPKAQDHYILDGSYIWFPIKEVKPLGYEDTVYNIEVENSHSYTANNIVVHNCQGFSMAGKMLNFDDPRSKLFFEFVRLVKEIQPKYFLLENVKMKKEFQDVISGYMGVEPIEIDSALVSAQRRKRLYWTNIPGVTQPKDKGIMLKDILESNAPDKYNLTERGMKMLMRNFGSKGQALNFDPSVLFKITYPSVCEQQEGLDRKCPTLTASMGTGGGNVPCIIQKVGDRDKNNWGVRTDKSYTLPANPMSDRGQLVVEIPKEGEKLIDVVDGEVRVKQATKQGYIVAEEGDGISLSYPSSTTRRGRVVKGKSNALTACGQDSWVYEPMVAYAPGSREFEQQGFKTGKAPTLCARDYKDPKIVAIPCATQLGQSENFGTAYGSEKAYTLRASNPNGVIESIQPPRIRKLTPIECERLQTLSTTKHRYEILFDFDDYEWFIEQTKNYASVVEKCHKSQSAVGNVEKGDGKDAVLSAEKSLNTNSPQTNKLVQENVLTSGEGEGQVKLFLDEQSMYVSDAEKNLRYIHPINEENFALSNADIDMLFERIVHLGNEGSLEKEGIYITQKSGIIQLKRSGREIMQLVKGAEKDLTTLKRHFTSIILDHSNIENLEQKLATLFYYVLIAIVGCIQGITQTSNSLEINIEIGYTAGVSDTQRYKMLGNGWTVDVIAHIFSFLPKE